MKRKYSRLVLIGSLSLVLIIGTACTPNEVQEAVDTVVEEEHVSVDEPAVEDSTESEPVEEGEVVEEAESEDQADDQADDQAQEEGEDSLPPEPRQIPFTAADGYEQTGTYYPGTANPGPLVILMHWAPGDQTEWAAIAPWLQNRGMPFPESPDPGSPWLDSSWFPAIGENNSFGVFTFTFRQCEGGCAGFDPEGWLNDAYGAYEAAKLLPGVDPERMVIIGASIGADGAADACLEGCLGALSLSPGEYLGVSYSETVLVAEEEGKPMWCLAAEGDTASYETCSSAEGELYRSIIHPGSAHGMMLVVPDTYDPDTMDTILEFLDLTLGLE